MNIINLIKEKIENARDEHNKNTIAKALKFAKNNRNCLIVMLDGRSDDIVAAYQDVYVAAQVKSKYLGMKTGLVKHLILGNDDDRDQARNMNTLKSVIEEFLYQLPEVIKNKKVEEVNKELENNLKQLSCQK